MYIPNNIDNYIEFYNQCKSKKIILTSKYAGVGITKISQGIIFKASIRIGNKVSTKIFPFTKEGEEDAHTWYKDRRLQNPTNKTKNNGLLKTMRE